MRHVTHDLVLSRFLHEKEKQQESARARDTPETQSPAPLPRTAHASESPATLLPHSPCPSLSSSHTSTKHHNAHALSPEHYATPLQLQDGKGNASTVAMEGGGVGRGRVLAGLAGDFTVGGGRSSSQGGDEDKPRLAFFGQRVLGYAPIVRSCSSFMSQCDLAVLSLDADDEEEEWEEEGEVGEGAAATAVTRMPAVMVAHKDSLTLGTSTIASSSSSSSDCTIDDSPDKSARTLPHTHTRAQDDPHDHAVPAQLLGGEREKEPESEPSAVQAQTLQTRYAGMSHLLHDSPAAYQALHYAVQHQQPTSPSTLGALAYTLCLSPHSPQPGLQDMPVLSPGAAARATRMRNSPPVAVPQTMHATAHQTQEICIEEQHKPATHTAHKKRTSASPPRTTAHQSQQKICTTEQHTSSTHTAHATRSSASPPRTSAHQTQGMRSTGQHISSAAHTEQDNPAGHSAHTTRTSASPPRRALNVQDVHHSPRKMQKECASPDCELLAVTSISPHTHAFAGSDGSVSVGGGKTGSMSLGGGQLGKGGECGLRLAADARVRLEVVLSGCVERLF